ncbi:MAG: DegV family protein [Clostridia bacterium]|nr:DegV family protein [Clostridia bacterium]
MSKIKVICDSGGDIPKELAEKYQVTILPFLVEFGTESYRDYYDIDSNSFFQKLAATKEMPTTSQITAEQFLQAYEQAVKEGYDTILYFALSSKASGTYQNAHLAKNMFLEEHQADIEIIDSQAFAYVYGRIAQEAAEWALNGKTKEEIMTQVQYRLTHYDIAFVVDTLQYLKKGGRINPGVAAIGEILDIKPVLTIRDGLISMEEKIRGKKRVPAKLMKLLEKKNITQAKEVVVLHGSCPDTAAEYIDAMKETFGIARPQLVEVGPVIGVHTGPGVVAVVLYY